MFKNAGVFPFFSKHKWMLLILSAFFFTNPVYAFNLWGEKPHDQFYLGMWTYHFWHSDRYQSNNKLIGLQYNGYFVGGFSNSFSKPSFAAGVTRDFYSRELTKDIHLDLGYRLGAMTGYRHHIDLADHTYLVPFVQMALDLTYKQFGTELTWTGPVASITFFWRF